MASVMHVSADISWAPWLSFGGVSRGLLQVFLLYPAVPYQAAVPRSGSHSAGSCLFRLSARRFRVRLLPVQPRRDLQLRDRMALQSNLKRAGASAELPSATLERGQPCDCRRKRRCRRRQCCRNRRCNDW